VSLPILPLLVMLVVQAMVSMSIVAVAVLAPLAASDVGIGPDFVGFYIGLVYVGSMLASVSTGDLVRRFGSIRVSQACLLISAAGLALLQVGTLPAVAASALLLGCAQGPVTPASSHLLVRLTQPKDLALALSIKQTGVPLGGALAGALVPPLTVIGGWEFAGLAVTAACGALALAIQASRAAFDAERETQLAFSIRGVARPLRLAAGIGRVRRLAVCAFAFSALQLSVVTYLVTYLNTRLGYTLVQAGMMLAVLQVTSIFARILWGAMADRMRQPIALLALLALGMSACSMLIGLATSHWPTAAMATLCVAVGATALGWNGVVLGEVARAAPEGQAVEATGGVVFFTYFGVLVGPPAFALVVQQPGGYVLGFALLALAPLACSGWLAWTAIKARGSRPAPALRT
jgi:MFS family permease